MCGIFGYIGKKSSSDVCIEGLQALEYRGYDSAGIATITEGEIIVQKKIGKVEVLYNLMKEKPFTSGCAIAHTRWASHGGITESNAHPHADEKKTLALVHNGIIENFLSLKQMLEKEGIVFSSDTDTEVIAQLISYYNKGDLIEAMRKALLLVKGAFAIAIIHKDDPETIYAATRDCPLIIGHCNTTKEVYLSSDTNAFLGKSLDIFYLFDDEFCVLRKGNIEVYDNQGNKVLKRREFFHAEEVLTSKGEYEHFLLKEIHEQPLVVERALSHRLDFVKGSVSFEELEPMKEAFTQADQIILLACGSAYHAGFIAKRLFEEKVGILTRVEIASEFRYNEPRITEKTLVIAISQSGETADTLAATKEALAKGAKVLSLCNVKNSSLWRLATANIHLSAGPEISVCSTKAFTSQLVHLFLIALFAARERGLSHEEGMHMIRDMENLPRYISEVLSLSEEILFLADRYLHYKDFFFVGRQEMYGTSLEAALKFKEISYINACGYPAGEMKHGPIALVSPDLATVSFGGNVKTFDKLLSNLREIKARGGPIIAFVPEDAKEILDITKDVIFLPKGISDLSAPIPYSVAGQLFAYHFASLLGNNIDKPRNLAKSVTIE